MATRKTVPKVSIVTISFNPRPEDFRRSLESIKGQTYPQDRIEHIVADGGSSEEIVRMAETYGCHVIVRRDLQSNGEARRSVCLMHATGELVFALETDNILPNPTVISDLVQPFIDDPSLVASFPAHYHVSPHMNHVDRYCALVGAGDPVALYLGKADRDPWFFRRYSKGISHGGTAGYELIDFSEDTLPTVGDNGFMSRRSLLLKADISQEGYFHIDVFMDILRLGYTRYAAVHTSVEHLMGHSFIQLIRRRVVYAKQYAVSETSLKRRRYLVFDPKRPRDVIRLAGFMLASATFIEPLLFAVRGWVSVRDPAWFYHPLVCWLFMVYYVRYTGLNAIRTIFRKSL